MKNKIALVTGSSGEIGNAIVEKLSDAGCRVVGLDLVLPEQGTAERYVQCDLRDFSAIANCLKTIREEMGTIQLLVNNAAYYKLTPFLELTPEQIQTTLSVNVAALMYLCQQVSLQLIDNKSDGVFVNVASIAGRNGSSQADYGASKAGVINLTKTLGRMLAPHDIRINAVAPALVGTGMGLRLAPGVKEKFLEMTPLKRAAEPEEVANVVHFLMSDQASYLTGTTIDLDGGL